MKKKILIIGSEGFLAKNLYIFFLKKKYNVFNSITFSKFKIDLNNKYFTKKKVDIVIDCSWSGVENFSKNNKKIQNLNITFTNNLTYLLRQLKPKLLISFGSQAEYGFSIKKISETDTCNPKTLYAKIKLKKKKILEEFCKSNNIKFNWLRIFAIYGPYDKPFWFIPYVINSLLKKKIPNLTSGEQKWDYLHVRDVCEACKIILQKNSEGTYNIAFGKLYKIKKIALLIKKMIKSKVNIKFDKKVANKKNLYNMKADVSKLSYLGWRPKISLTEGIKETISFYEKKYFNKF